MKYVYESLILDEHINVTGLAFNECADEHIWVARLNSYMGRELPLPRKPILDPNPGAAHAKRLPWVCRIRALVRCAAVRAEFAQLFGEVLAAADKYPELVPVKVYQAPRAVFNNAVSFFQEEQQVAPEHKA